MGWIEDLPSMVQDAPQGATIECNNSTQEAYAKALAKKYDRQDIKITNMLRPKGGTSSKDGAVSGSGEWGWKA